MVMDYNFYVYFKSYSTILTNAESLEFMWKEVQFLLETLYTLLYHIYTN